MIGRSREAVEAVRRQLSNPGDVCQRLGLLERAERTGGGLLICCPVHGDRKPSCSVRVAADRTIAVRCHACGWTGDVLTLLAAVERLDPRRDFAAVLGRAAELAGVSIDDPPPRRELPPLPAREPPPVDQVRALLRAGVDVDGDQVVAGWLRSRGLDPAACVPLACALGPDWLPWSWASYRRRSWTVSGHRLLLPLFDALGELRSVRARAVVADATPKSLPPGGHASAGFLLADARGVAMLRAGPTAAPARVLVLEGEPDYLTWASRSSGRWAVFGLPGSGAWTSAIGDRIPAGSEVVIRTDPDPAGDHYAEIVATPELLGRCSVRVSDPEGRARRRAWVAHLKLLEAQRAGVAELAAARKALADLVGLDENARHVRGELGTDPREGTGPA